MTAHYYISKSWILSTAARRVYRVAAVFSIGLFVFLMLHRLQPNLLAPRSSTAEVIIRWILFLTVLGAATTLVAMEYFLFTYDESPAWKMVLWFLAMVILGLGAALYCFFVYSRSQHFQNVASASSDLYSPTSRR